MARVARRPGGNPKDRGVFSPPVAPQGALGTKQSVRHFCLVWFPLITWGHVLRPDSVAFIAKESMPMTLELVG